MSRLISSLDAHKHLKASMTACSWTAGWRSVLLRSYVDPPSVDEFTTPATADHLIVLVTDGKCDIEARYGGRWQQAHYEAGHIGMTGPGEEVTLRWRGETSHSTLQMHLPSESLHKVLRDFSDRDPQLFTMPSKLTSSDPVIQQVMLGMETAVRTGAPELYAETARDFLIAHVLVGHAGLAEPKPLNPTQRRLRQVDEFIRAHLDASLSLEEIAREAGLSRFHTLRLFKRAYGETPARRVARLRMERAKDLLATGEEPITEIAFRCGYDNSAHFAVAFRRWAGLSPREYRNQRGRPAHR
jgi:AraC family transcriptional regulator